MFSPFSGHSLVALQDLTCQMINEYNYFSIPENGPLIAVEAWKVISDYTRDKIFCI